MSDTMTDDKVKIKHSDNGKTDVTPASMDWNSIPVAKAATPIRRQYRNSVDLAATPFPRLYESSKASGETLDVGPLPNDDAVKTAVRLIRQAANAVGGGVTIRVDEAKRVVSFAARDKKVIDPDKPRRPKQLTNEPDDAYAPRLAEFEQAAKAWNAEHPDDLVKLTPNRSGK